jgi:23S rRNA (uracil1939-C5)-methyltransferase
MEDKIPVNKNEYYEIMIEDLGHEGEGIGKVSGFTVFVPGALPGDEAKVKVIKVKKSYAYGKLIEVLEPSPNRVEQRCPMAGPCGGCHIQHMSYEAQLDFKTRIVRENLKRIGKIEGVTVKHCIGAEHPWRYRNKTQLPVREGAQGAVVGFYAPRSHRIVPMETCLIQHENNDEASAALREYMNTYKVPAYDEITGKGLIRHLVTRIGFTTGETMIVLVAADEKLPNIDGFVEITKRHIPHVTTIVLNINSKKTNVILGEKNVVLYGKGFITDRLGGHFHFIK